MARLTEAMLKDALDRVGEDKSQNLSTTSLLFKTDLWKHFSDGFDDKVCVEFGTHKGQTTHVLSYLFKKVYTINRTEESLKEAKTTNRDRDNIIYMPFDLYGNIGLIIPETVTMIFIDAGHSHAEVRSDIERAAQMSRTKPSYAVFDDYGIWPGVAQAVNELVNNGVLEIVHLIGHKQGHDFGNGAIINNLSEGVICKLLV